MMRRCWNGERIHLDCHLAYERERRERGLRRERAERESRERDRVSLTNKKETVTRTERERAGEESGPVR